MVCAIPKKMASSQIIFFILFSFALIWNQTSSVIAGESNQTIPKFPAVLIFGDSTVDSGNNDYINTVHKCDHPPYGMNFPGGVTGRCTDGKLTPDMFASMIGSKEFFPPFLKPNLSDEDILTGVSFASVGSGYDDTNSDLSVIPVPGQVAYFRKYILRLEGISGKEAAAGKLEKALVVLSAGTNDFVWSFYLNATKRTQFNSGQYGELVLNKLTNFIKELLKLGCRNILVVGLPPMGCLPIELTLNIQIFGGCVDHVNADARFFNDKLRDHVLPQLQAGLPDSKLIYGDIYTPILDMVNNPKNYGFVETRRGCCGSGLIEFGLLCTEHSGLCKNVDQYVFFDSVHPTQSAYKVIAQALAENSLTKFG